MKWGDTLTTGERIKQCRKRLSLSAETLASIVGVSPATVYRWEKGDIEKVPGYVLEPLADALQTTPAYLAGWGDDQDTPVFSDLDQEGTPTFRIISSGLSELQEAEQKRLLDVLRAMYPDVRAFFKEDDSK